MKHLNWDDSLDFLSGVSCGSRMWDPAFMRPLKPLKINQEWLCDFWMPHKLHKSKAFLCDIQGVCRSGVSPHTPENTNKWCGIVTWHRFAITSLIRPRRALSVVIPSLGNIMAIRDKTGPHLDALLKGVEHSFVIGPGDPEMICNTSSGLSLGSGAFIGFYFCKLPGITMSWVTMCIFLIN